MDFIQIQFLDIVDVLLVAFLMFQLYRLIRGTNAISIFIGILMVYVLWLIVRVLNMELLSLILGQIIGVGVIAIIIVFQPEIRKFLFLLGERYSKRKNSFWGRLLFGKGYKPSTEWIEYVINACIDMSIVRTGALIVISRNNNIDEFTTQGVEIDANIKSSLIESIFFKNSPLHDGAMIIDDGRIKSARCILPVSQSSNIPSYLGTRHRAALGISEISDAIVIVVSEERGKISVALEGKIGGDLSRSELKELLIRNLENA